MKELDRPNTTSVHYILYKGHMFRHLQDNSLRLTTSTEYMCTDTQ